MLAVDQQGLAAGKHLHGCGRGGNEHGLGIVGIEHFQRFLPGDAIVIQPVLSLEQLHRRARALAVIAVQHAGIKAQLLKPRLQGLYLIAAGAGGQHGGRGRRGGRGHEGLRRFGI